MKLEELFETEQYKTRVTAEEAWDLLNTHCKDALKDINQPIWRGMNKIKGGLGIIHGEAGARKSANTSNFYTIILDEVLGKKGYPLRSKCIICANNNNVLHANSYGSLYAIVPYDGVKIGVCPYGDMFDTTLGPGLPKKNIEAMNGFFDGVLETDMLTYKELINELKEAWAIHAGLRRIFKGPNDIQPKIEKAYLTPNWKLATTSTSELYNDGKEHELWIGGKCVAIKRRTYKDMVDAYSKRRK